MRAVAADHQLDDLCLGESRRGAGARQVAVAQDRDLVGDLQHLFQLVGDKDDGDAFAPDLEQQLEQIVRLVAGQRGGRLVQDQKAGICREGPGDHDQLFLGGAQPADHRAGRQIQSDQVDVALSFLLQALPVDGAPPGKALDLVEHDVFGDGALGDDLDFLAHQVDLPVQGILVGAQVHRLAVDEHRAVVGRVDAADNLDERALARAVFAHDGMDLSRQEFHGDVMQRPHAGEIFADLPDLQHLVLPSSPCVPSRLRAFLWIYFHTKARRSKGTRRNERLISPGTCPAARS